jgi:hypothetical protein
MMGSLPKVPPPVTAWRPPAPNVTTDPSGFWAHVGTYLSGPPGFVISYLAIVAAGIAGCVVAKAPIGSYLKAFLASALYLVLSMLLAALLEWVLPAWLSAALVFPVALYIAYRHGLSGFSSGSPGPRLHRGAAIETLRGIGTWSSKPDASLSASTTPHPLTLAGLPVPPLDETKHFKLIGTTGTGKSTAIRELLTGALRRSDRAVIADADGAYLARFFDPSRGDLILNPFDARSRKWDLSGEIKEPYDFAELARSLIPDGEGDQRMWRQYGQTFLAAVMRRAHGAGARDIGELFRLVTAAPLEELQVLLEGTPAQPFVTASNQKMFASIRAVTTSAVSALEYIQRQGADPLSIRRWVREGKGVLFLPYSAGQIAALRTLISTWMRTAIFETMNLPEGDARLWFVIDELDALGPIDGLKDALPRLRKFGGRCILGFQSIGQVSATYGRGEADTIVENCGNTLILRCSASEEGGTARFASKLIGEREIIREHVSYSRHPSSVYSTKTRSEQHVTETAVFASEIEQLPDLHGYLKFPSEPDWKRVTLDR